MSPQLSTHAAHRLWVPSNRKEFNMPQMFDWIFFAIVLLPTAFLVVDWLRNR